MQQQRNGFARFVVDPVEGLGGRLPRPGIENIPQRLLGTKKRIPIAVVQSIVLKQGLDFEQFGHDSVARHEPQDIRFGFTLAKGGVYFPFARNVCSVDNPPAFVSGSFGSKSTKVLSNKYVPSIVTTVATIIARAKSTISRLLKMVAGSVTSSPSPHLQLSQPDFSQKYL
jgi:hypothetical protein